jgi:hypothetical protein
MRKSYREPSVDASYQVSVHLAKLFQRRRFKCEINRRRTSSDGKYAHGHNRGWIMGHHFTLGLKIYKVYVVSYML